MPLVRPIPQNPKPHHKRPQDRTPVHRLVSDRDRDGEERKGPGDDDPQQGEDVNRKTQTPHIPWSESQGNALETSVRHQGDRYEIGTKDGGDDEGNDGVESH